MRFLLLAFLIRFGLNKNAERLALYAADGSAVAAVSIKYGLFLNSLIQFIIVAFAIFLVVNIGVGSFMDPILVGRHLRLSPIIVLVSLLLQGWTIKPMAQWLGLIVPPRIGPVERVGLE